MFRPYTIRIFDQNLRVIRSHLEYGTMEHAERCAIDLCSDLKGHTWDVIVDENAPFRALWNEIRDYYAPTMSAPEATKKAMAAMSGIGFEVYPLTRTMFLVDDKPFEIKKVRDHVHFDLIQHDVRI